MRPVSFYFASVILGSTCMLAGCSRQPEELLLEPPAVGEVCEPETAPVETPPLAEVCEPEEELLLEPPQVVEICEPEPLPVETPPVAAACEPTPTSPQQPVAKVRQPAPRKISESRGIWQMFSSEPEPTPEPVPAQKPAVAEVCEPEEELLLEPPHVVENCEPEPVPTQKPAVAEVCEPEEELLLEPPHVVEICEPEPAPAQKPAVAEVCEPEEELLLEPPHAVEICEPEPLPVETPPVAAASEPTPTPPQQPVAKVRQPAPRKISEAHGIWQKFSSEPEPESESVPAQKPAVAEVCEPEEELLLEPPQVVEICEPEPIPAQKPAVAEVGEPEEELLLEPPQVVEICEPEPIPAQKPAVAEVCEPEEELLLEPPQVAEVCEPEIEEDRSVHVVETQGIILVPNAQSLLPPEELCDIEGLYLKNVDLPGNIAQLEEELTPLYCGKPLDFSQIEKVKQAIVRYYLRNDRPFVHVVVPPQNVTAGVLQLVVQENKAGEIKVEGPYAETIRRYIQLEPGSPISQGKLTKNIDFLNRHPFRRVDVVIGPGQKQDTTDLDFIVKKRHSYFLTVGVDNTGIPTIGRNRFFASATWGKPIGPLDSVLSYQYTTAYNRKRFDAHTLQYNVFLESGNLLNFYGGHSGVHVDLPFPNMKNHGISNQFSTRYTGFLDSKRLWSRSVTVGFDWKRTNNTVEFQEQLPTISNTVNLTQLMIGCEFHRSDEQNDILFAGEAYWSPGEWLPNQSNTDFQSLRPQAQNDWIYGHLSGQWGRTLPHGFLSFLKVRAQFSSACLLPSEQLGVGGFTSVRGYDERQLNFDTGMLLNWEIRAPAFAVLTKVRGKAIKDGLQFLAFLDAGGGYDRHGIPGVISRNWLMSVGPGVRYTLSEFLTGRLDWGIKLHHKPEFGGGRNEFHFGVTGNY